MIREKSKNRFIFQYLKQKYINDVLSKIKVVHKNVDKNFFVSLFVST